MSVWSTEFKGCKYALGIDLGTTNSCVAMWRMEKQNSKVYKNLNGHKTFPSVVAFCGGKEEGGDPGRGNGKKKKKKKVYDWSPAVGEMVEAARKGGGLSLIHI